jgi:hypothetical protein
MMTDESVTCYILGVTSTSGLNYASLRGNEIGAKFVHKPNHHDLSHIVLGLRESLQDHLKVSEVIVRYANLMKYSDAEKTALRLICKWPSDCLQLLVRMISKYEVYQTADTDVKMMKKSQDKIQKGEKLIMPMTMFKHLAKIPHDFLMENGDSILNGKLSIKLLLLEFTKTEERKKKVAKIEEVAGYRSIDSLRLDFPEKFTQDILDKLPVVKASSSRPVLESYTNSVLNNIQKESQTDFKELESVEFEEDILEMKKLLKYSKRPNVKKELESLMKRFENNLKEFKTPVEDPYKFEAHCSNTGTNFLEEMQSIEKKIDVE